MSQIKHHGWDLFGVWVVSDSDTAYLRSCNHSSHQGICVVLSLLITSESYLHMHFRVGVHVVKQTLVVVVLLVPLQGLIIAEVIAERNQQNLTAEQFRLLAVLVQKEVGPGGKKQHQWATASALNRYKVNTHFLRKKMSAGCVAFQKVIQGHMVFSIYQLSV